MLFYAGNFKSKVLIIEDFIHQRIINSKIENDHRIIEGIKQLTLSGGQKNIDAENRGFFALIQDSEGNRVGLYSAKNSF